MRKYFVLVLAGFAALVTAGCVTTTTGDMPPPASSKESARINRELGVSYLRKGDYNQAMSKLRKSVDEEFDNPTAHRALGMVYEQLGDLDGAEKEYRIAVRQAPKDPDVVGQLAVYLCINGDSKEALKEFDKALAIPLNSGRYVTYTNAGTCAKRINELERADNYLRKALASEPKYPSALLQLADVTYRQEYYLQSRAFIERYFAVGSASSTSLWLAYQVETALGDRGAADGFGKQLLRDFPESVEARTFLEQRRNAG